MPSPIPRVDVDAGAERLVSPTDTKAWKSRMVQGQTVFIRPDGSEVVRAHPLEKAAVIVTFAKSPNDPPMRLVVYDGSSKRTRAARAKRAQEERKEAKRSTKAKRKQQLKELIGGEE